MLFALAVVLVAVPFLTLLLLVEEHVTGLREVDDGARDALHSVVRHHEVYVKVLQLLSFSGTTAAWTVVFVPVVGWLLWRRLARLATFVVVTVSLSSVLNNLVKVLVHRARPVLSQPVAHANGTSFPSGHAQAALVGYGVLLLVFLPVLRGAWRRAALGFAVATVLAIGFSRVALGVHYVSDVLAGYLLGAAWLAAMTAAFSAWRRERGRPSVAPREGLAPEQAGRLAGDHHPAGGPTTQNVPPE